MTFSYSRCQAFIDGMRHTIASHTAGDPLGGHQNDGWPGHDETFEAAQEAGLTMDDFIELDQRPGQFDPHYRRNGWHMCLRYLRNNGPNEFFDYLNRKGEYAE